MCSGVFAMGYFHFDVIPGLKSKVDLVSWPLSNRQVKRIDSAHQAVSPSGGGPDPHIDGKRGESLRGAFAHAERIIMLFG